MVKNNDGDPNTVCDKSICYFGEMPVFAIAIAFLVIRFTWQVYASLILRQHWINKRDGLGDAGHCTLPPFVSQSQCWVSELRWESSAQQECGTDKAHPLV